MANVVTVEHNAKWFSLLEKEVVKNTIQNWKGLLRPAQEGIGENLSIADPDAYVSDDVLFKGCHFREYASAIDAFSDAFFDVVLVDGRARPSCLKHALPKIKAGGLLILDNSDREYYLEQSIALITPIFRLLLDGKGPVPYLEGFSQTTVWIKQ